MKAIEMITNEFGVTSSTLSPNDLMVDGNIEWEKSNLKPNTVYACVMIELPKGKRLVTDEERAKYDTPPKPMCCSGIYGGWWDGNGVVEWDKDYLYCVDSDYQFEPPLPVVKLTIGGKDVELSPESIKAIQELTK